MNHTELTARADVAIELIKLQINSRGELHLDTVQTQSLVRWLTMLNTTCDQYARLITELLKDAEDMQKLITKDSSHE